MNLKRLIVWLFGIFVIISAKGYVGKLDRHLIACLSTDFTCFKRQYLALKDYLLLGNEPLGIAYYEPFIFSYGDTGTCIKITGVEESELVAVGMNSESKEYTISIAMPVKIQQMKSTSEPCATPDLEFGRIGPHKGALKKFAGNATATVTYPYNLHKKKGKVYLHVEEETLEMMVDMPYLKDYDRESEQQTMLFQLSEWAYEMVRHVDVAQHCLAPFIGNFHVVMDHIPLEKFLLLYPEEEYFDLQFSFNIKPPF